MNVYRYAFLVGFLNLSIPFLGVPFVFKQYAFVTLGVTTMLYALYIRAIAKEQEAGLSYSREESYRPANDESARTIEQVVEMHEAPAPAVRKRRVTSAKTDVKPVRRGRKPKVGAAAHAQLVHEESYE